MLWLVNVILTLVFGITKENSTLECFTSTSQNKWQFYDFNIKITVLRLDTIESESWIANLTGMKLMFPYHYAWNVGLESFLHNLGERNEREGGGLSINAAGGGFLWP